MPNSEENSNWKVLVSFIIDSTSESSAIHFYPLKTVQFSIICKLTACTIKLYIYTYCFFRQCILLKSFVSIKKLPIEREEIKLALETLNEKIKPTDNLYVYYGAVPAIKFYRNDLLINEDKIVYGNEYRDSPENYFQEIDQLEGTTWIICTHYLDGEIARIQQKFEKKGEKNIVEQNIPNNTSKIYLISEK